MILFLRSGIAFVNREDENIREISIDKNHIGYGLDPNTCDYYASNIQINEEGSNFEVHMKGRKHSRG